MQLRFCGRRKLACVRGSSDVTTGAVLVKITLRTFVASSTCSSSYFELAVGRNLNLWQKDLGELSNKFSNDYRSSNPARDIINQDNQGDWVGPEIPDRGMTQALNRCSWIARYWTDLARNLLSPASLRREILTARSPSRLWEVTVKDWLDKGRRKDQWEGLLHKRSYKDISYHHRFGCFMIVKFRAEILHRDLAEASCWRSCHQRRLFGTHLPISQRA